jgi:hypothetical protein
MNLSELLRVAFALETLICLWKGNRKVELGTKHENISVKDEKKNTTTY